LTTAKVAHLLCFAQDSGAPTKNRNYRSFHCPAYPKDYLFSLIVAAVVSAQEFLPIHSPYLKFKAEEHQLLPQKALASRQEVVKRISCTNFQGAYLDYIAKVSLKFLSPSWTKGWRTQR